MTFDSFESSTEQSRPVELYRFAQGNDVFLYNSSEDEIVVGIDTYDPISIERSGIVKSSEDRNKQLTITVPVTNPFVAQYRQIVPGQRATVTVFRFQRPEGTGDLIQIFKGFVQTASFTKNALVGRLLCLPIESASSRPVPRFTYMSLCNHVLYDGRCKVLETDFDLQANVSAVSDNVITLPGAGAFGADFFVGGFVQFASIADFRLIIDQSGDDLTLLLPFPSNATGQLVTAFAGCDHTLPTCKVKFDNVENYGGFAYVPTRNPFEVGIA